MEVPGDQVTLSAIGLMFLDEVRSATRLVPFLSPQAWDAGDPARGAGGCRRSRPHLAVRNRLSQAAWLAGRRGRGV